MATRYVLLMMMQDSMLDAVYLIPEDYITHQLTVVLSKVHAMGSAPYGETGEERWQRRRRLNKLSFSIGKLSRMPGSRHFENLAAEPVALPPGALITGLYHLFM